MDILKWFGASSSSLKPLPKGSFTVDTNGRVLASTLPHDFSEDMTRTIGQTVQKTFISAHESQRPIHEFVVRYSNLKITARELRGGAIIFLTPQTLKLNNN